MGSREILSIPGILLFGLAPVYGCAMSDRAETADDYVTAEQAVILWDEAHKIEHFIRQADIDTKSPDLGFLVPTPQTPELVEADSNIFKLAADTGKPKLVRRIYYRTPLEIFGPLLYGPTVLAAPFFGTLSGMSDGEAPVQIIMEQNVAGYHAVVLAADNPAALTQWLTENGYVSTPELIDWLKPYVARKWKITAFKLIRGTPLTGPPLVTHAIRMSFSTEHPFFPYSEPMGREKARKSSPYGRTLQVSILGTGRMQGALEDGKPWPAVLLFSGPSTPPSPWSSSDWLRYAKLESQIAQPLTLTHWRDRSNPRPGTSDLFFLPSPEQKPFRATEIDEKKTPLHLINFLNPLSDLAGILIVVLWPGAPLYCGWQVLRLGRGRTGIKNPKVLKAGPLFILVTVIFGGFYSIACGVISYYLGYASEWLPGKPMPPFSTPPIAAIVGLLFLTQVWCGIETTRLETASVSPTEGSFRKYLNNVMAVGSLFIGASFALAVIVAFVTSFFH